jgi:hypothetical protein
MGYRVVRRTRSPWKYSKSYPTQKKAERARKRLKGKSVIRS